MKDSDRRVYAEILAKLDAYPGVRVPLREKFVAEAKAELDAATKVYASQIKPRGKGKAADPDTVPAVLDAHEPSGWPDIAKGDS